MGTLGARTLLVNPPLIGGIAFTRQGRCQEREEVLGTTKPPYTLALVAALLRDRGVDLRLADLTATGESVEDLIAKLDRESFSPTLIVFPSTTPTIDADIVEMAKLKARYGAPLFSFGPHASCTPEASMKRAPVVDGMFVGEPEVGWAEGWSEAGGRKRVLAVHFVMAAVVLSAGPPLGNAFERE